MLFPRLHEPTFLRFALTYSFRSLGRNPRRSALTLFTVFLACAVSLVAARYSDALFRLWEESSADAGAGHAQIHKQGWWTSPDGLKSQLMMDAGTPIEQMLTNDPNVVAFAHRVRFEGIISSGRKNLYFIGQGVDPAAESVVSPRLFGDAGLHNRLPTTSGPRGIFGDDPNNPGVVIGKGLADTLGLHLGDPATLLAQTLEGGMNGLDVVVRGIVDIPLPSLSKRSVYVHIDYARRVLALGDKSSEIAVRLRSHDIADAWVAAHRDTITAQGNELRGYWEVEPIIRKVAGLFDAVMGLVCLLLFISTAISVLNIIVMVVNERLSEIGTLMAIGARGRDVRGLFTFEGALIGLLGGCSGVVGGGIALLLMHLIGIRFQSPLGSGILIVRPTFEIRTAVLVIVVSVLVCMASALLPAIRAARIEPYAAFRRLVR